MTTTVPYRIVIKTSTTNATPSPSDLITGEIAFSFVSGGLFIKYPDNSVRQINANGGNVTWGAISGNITDSTSLMAALNAKQDLLNIGSGLTLSGNVLSVNYSTIVGTPPLGNSSSLNVGSVAGTVAAGDHTHTKAMIGLGNVDNTSDINKPISTAVQTALNAKQDVLTPGTNITISNGVISSTASSSGGIVTWDSITNKPTTFPPSAHNHVKAEVGLGNVDNTSDPNKPISIATQFALDQKVDKTTVGSASGIATLDSNSILNSSQVPPSLLGAVRYQGTWNASTNVPPMAIASSSNKGYYFKVSTTGNTVIDGISQWNSGDWIISNGTTWDRVQTQGAVTSVSGRTGDVTLTKSDVGLSNVDNTSDINKPISTATQNALNAKVNSNLLGAASGVATLDPSSKIVTSQLPTATLTSLNDQGTWNATSNLPMIGAASSANKGFYYRVSTAGTTTIDGISLWEVGDWIVSNGTTWTKVQTANRVTSVAGKTGVVTLQISDIPGLQTAIDTSGPVLSVSGKTGVVSLQIADVSGLQTALNNAGLVSSVSGKTGDVIVTKSDVGLGNVDNTSDANKPISTATQNALDLKASTAVATTSINGLLSATDKIKLDTVALNATANSSDAFLLDRTNHTGSQAISTVTNLQSSLDAKESLANKGVANGYAPLDINSKIPSANLPDTVTGSLNYQGVWNASTNTPTIPTGSSGNKGFYYKVAVSGNTNIDGNSTWNVGDWIVSNGSTWDRIQTTDNVISVAGKIGIVTLTSSDVGLGNVDNTSDINKPISTAVQTALNGKASTAVVTTSANGLMVASDKTKLDGIAAGATVNSTDFYLLNRANHSGTQPISSITSLQSTLDSKQNTLIPGTGISIIGNTISSTGGGSGTPSIYGIKQTNITNHAVVNASITQVQLIAANFNRIGLMIVNTSSSNMYVTFGSSSNYSIILKQNEIYESNNFVSTGQVTAYWDSATGNAQVTEMIDNQIGYPLVRQASASTLVQTSANTLSTTILNANSNRFGFIIENDTTGTMYISFNSTSSTTAYTVALPPNSIYESANFVHTGPISAIWNSGVTGFAMTTELSQ
ncbi:MAG TPA: hypothetical protein VFM18_00435 [Methanosarcina sp.]|nr:hypothetical protein [Methanosarcina sp.]